MTADSKKCGIVHQASAEAASPSESARFPTEIHRRKGPRKVARLFGERRNNGMSELCLEGQSE